jgi:hypothetical protein
MRRESPGLSRSRPNAKVRLHGRTRGLAKGPESKQNGDEIGSLAAEKKSDPWRPKNRGFREGRS